MGSEERFTMSTSVPFEVKVNDFISFVKAKQGEVITTRKRNKGFTVEVTDKGFEFTPTATNKRRPHEFQAVKRVVERFNKTRSYTTSDYTDITYNSSYTLTLIGLYLDLSPIGIDYWKVPVKAKNGTLRKQYAQWKLPEALIRHHQFSDGDLCLIEIKAGGLLWTQGYRLTSGGEIRIKKEHAQQLQQAASANADLLVEFRLVKELEAESSSQHFEDAVAESLKLTSDERETRLAKYPQVPQRKAVVATEFVRNPHVVAERLRVANGKCEACGKNAPFNRKSDGTPYLEVHHRITLADSGLDTVENTIALCPNCHRQAHYG
jgi:5-methylcytosine-specific restriction endonuclease McrA